MELSLGVLIGFCVLAGAVALWQASLAARERANRAAFDACARLRLQLLDGTVAFTAARIVRGPRGWLTLRRTYVFDYTADSIARSRGFVVLSGTAVESVGFERDGTSAEPAEPANAPPAAIPTARTGHVLNLDTWRRRRSTRFAFRDADRDGNDRGPAH